MLFTNSRQIIKHSPLTPPNKVINFPIMGLNRVNRTPLPTLVEKKSTPVRAIAAVTPNNPKPIKWGAPTWFLFHTLAEKIKEENFYRLRKELLDIIYSICINLPCPICSTHATEYLNGINFNAITTKAQLKLMLFEFHNAVNKRKGMPIFTLSELDEKYANANTGAIINHFMQHFQNKSYNIRLIADELHRKKLINNLTTWFSANIHAFN